MYDVSLYDVCTYTYIPMFPFLPWSLRELGLQSCCWPLQLLAPAALSAAGPLSCSFNCWPLQPFQLLAPSAAGPCGPFSCWPLSCWPLRPFQLLAPQLLALAAPSAAGPFSC